MNLLKPVFIALAAIIAIIACEQRKSVNSPVLTPSEFEKTSSKTADAVIIDVCSPAEFNRAHLKNAVNINFNGPDFEGHISQLEKNKPYFVYCYVGQRSANAAKLMREMGFTKVYELEGGLKRWMQEGKPTEQEIKGPMAAKSGKLCGKICASKKF